MFTPKSNTNNLSNVAKFERESDYSLPGDVVTGK
jgi:hypothetical protein